MKLCIDCKRYQAATGKLRHMDEQTGRWVIFELPDLCLSKHNAVQVDLVTGESMGGIASAKECRADGERCGEKGNWFEPGTLDGRLAMLEDEEKPQ